MVVFPMDLITREFIVEQPALAAVNTPFEDSPFKLSVFRIRSVCNRLHFFSSHVTDSHCSSNGLVCAMSSGESPCLLAICNSSSCSSTPRGVSVISKNSELQSHITNLWTKVSPLQSLSFSKAKAFLLLIDVTISWMISKPALFLFSAAKSRADLFHESR